MLYRWYSLHWLYIFIILLLLNRQKVKVKFSFICSLNSCCGSFFVELSFYSLFHIHICLFLEKFCGFIKSQNHNSVLLTRLLTGRPKNIKAGLSKSSWSAWLARLSKRERPKFRLILIIRARIFKIFLEHFGWPTETRIEASFDFRVFRIERNSAVQGISFCCLIIIHINKLIRSNMRKLRTLRINFKAGKRFLKEISYWIFNI